MRKPDRRTPRARVRHVARDRVPGYGRRLVVANVARLTLGIALVAFAFVVLTGLFLFGVSAPKWLHTTEFAGKMGLVALGGVNAAALHLTAWRGADVWGAAHARAPRSAHSFAAVSMVVWLAVAILGRYLGYVPPVASRFISGDEIEQLMEPGGPLDIF